MTFDETIMAPSIKKKMKNIITTKEIPNLLFAGPPGTGKTVSCRALLYEVGVDPGDILFLNGSSVNSIDDVRNIIQPFAFSMSSNQELPLRFVFIDEFDRMSPQAQDACKTLIEVVYGSARFILTANHSKRIIPALHSRLQTFILEKPSIEEIAGRAITILESEEVEIESEDDLLELIRNNSTDIRKLIQMLQQNTVIEDDGTKVLRVSVVEAGGSAIFHDYLKHLKDNDGKALRKMVFSKFTDTDADEFWSLMIEDITNNSDDYEELGSGIDNTIYHLNDCQKVHEFVPDKRLNIIGFTIAALDVGE